MNRNIVWLSLILLLCLWPHNTLAGQPLTWEIQGEHNTVHITGSIHVLREDDYPLPERLLESWQQTDELVLEITLDAATMQKVNQTMLEHGQLHDGKTLADVLTAETLGELEALLAEIGLPLGAVAHLRPWALALMLTMQRIQAAGYRTDLGVDMYLFERAGEEDRPVRGLEDVDDQLEVLYGMDPEMEENFLRHSLAELDAVESEVPRLVAAWRNGDAEALETLLVAGFEEFPEVYERALVQRNEAWVPQLEALLDDRQDYLVVVGAAHLVGPGNVIELLRARGLEVNRLRDND